METFDYVIIGSGSAGSVLTNRLSEDANTSVCVLEAGPSDWHPYIHLPAGFIKTFHMKSVNWAYQQEPGPYTGGRSIYAPRGKTLGGSSSINGHIYNRGQRQDFDTWAQMGNRGWSYSDVLPYFKRMERRIGEGHEDYRGREGPLRVTNPEPRAPKATGLPLRSAIVRAGLSPCTTNMPAVAYIAARMLGPATERAASANATSPVTRPRSTSLASSSGTFSVEPLVLRHSTWRDRSTALITSATTPP